MMSKVCHNVTKYVMTSKHVSWHKIWSNWISKFWRHMMSKVCHNVTKYVMTSKHVSWHKKCVTDIQSMENMAGHQNISHDIKSMKVWRHKVRHDIKKVCQNVCASNSASWRQSECPDIKSTDIKKYGNMSRCQKIRHDITTYQKYVMMTNNRENTSWRQKLFC